MEQLLLTLSDLDHQIKAILAIEEINTEEINHLVDKRERILQNLLMYASENPRFANSAQWHTAIDETKQLVELMQSKTVEIGKTLQKYRHGNKSVQQYKKFL
ncbi:flagellar protein FliT [Vibrio aestuarianus]|uniref:Flagellar protein FliT n=1 Tax=Vibrio aestuarianus TaxID=28171 RepID=A0AAX3U2F3_9VIBR|nr:flagellar protein FliT [Vibrio aestuarianus]MDE1238362.1 flagellar protein FliT [Vibrio aestuarianus]WGK80704.1 flagellar protein FliT [Vibrio aestuarianus]